MASSSNVAVGGWICAREFKPTPENPFVSLAFFILANPSFSGYEVSETKIRGTDVYEIVIGWGSACRSSARCLLTSVLRAIPKDAICATPQG
jgi:hypothetical protein